MQATPSEFVRCPNHWLHVHAAVHQEAQGLLLGIAQRGQMPCPSAAYFIKQLNMPYTIGYSPHDIVKKL